MRNITVSVDDETHRLARIRAAELDTSVSALVREYLQALTDADFLEGDREVGIEKEKIVAQDTAVDRHVQQLYDEARARAEAVAGRPIRDVQELVEFRGQLLKDVAANFRAKGIGISMPGVLNREEMYDRSRARLEAELAAAEERGEELKGELVALRTSIEDTSSSTLG